MQRFPVTGGQAVSIGYDEDAQILEIEFTENRVYQYDKVPESLFEELMQSKSVETIIQNNLNQNYSARKI